MLDGQDEPRRQSSLKILALIGTSDLPGRVGRQDLHGLRRPRGPISHSTSLAPPRAAPGQNIRQLLLSDQIGTATSGTSPAAALVSGSLALLRSKFPNESAREIVTRAPYHVHNGLGGKTFAKRVDDNVGYG